MIPSIPKRSLRNLTVFAGVLAAVVGLLVVPSYLAIAKNETARDKIKKEVDEQRQLAPVFGKLLTKRRELNSASTNIPSRMPLGRDEAGSVADRITLIAVSSQLQMIGITSDLNAMVNDTQRMQVDIVLRGELESYQLFLKELIMLPHFEFIERLRITAISGGREYDMRIWIALK